MTIAVSAVTGTYNRLSHLKRLVASVRSSISPYPYEIVLVDGGSTDGTIEWCKSQPDVTLIEQGELLGAIKAFNAGCKAATGRYVAILNDDIEIKGKTLSTAYEYLEKYPQVGQVAFENDIRGKADPRRTRRARA
jgi:GT2 family glycosyltransferase